MVIIPICMGGGLRPAVDCNRLVGDDDDDTMNLPGPRVQFIRVTAYLVTVVTEDTLEICLLKFCSSVMRCGSAADKAVLVKTTTDYVLQLQTHK